MTIRPSKFVHVLPGGPIGRRSGSVSELDLGAELEEFSPAEQPERG